MTNGHPERYVAIDLETTGLFAETDRIVEIGAVRFDRSGQEFGRFERLIHPGRPMSPSAQKIHGISDADLANADPASVVVPEFLGWLGRPGSACMLAHHARFDAGFLGREIARLGLPIPTWPILDTLSLARHRLPTARNHKLDTVAEVLGLTADGPSHRALSDSLRVKGLWLALNGASGPRVSYPIFDPARSHAIPSGWEPLAAAMARGNRVRIRYAGGSRGAQPREITPKRFLHKGGTAYLVAHCHLDAFEKAFRLDRVLDFEVLDSPDPAGFRAPDAG